MRNSYEKLRNAGIYNLAANITGFEDAYNTAAESINNLSNSNTLININKNGKDAESYKYISTDEAMHDMGGIERRLRNESSERKLAELEVIANTIKNTSGRENAINNIITQQDNGILAERQKPTLSPFYKISMILMQYVCVVHCSLIIFKARKRALLQND